MHRRRRTVSLAVALAAALPTAACTSSDTGTASSAAGSSSADGGSTAASTSPGVYGAPADPSAPDLTDVATDSPPRSADDDSGGDVSVLLTYSGWNAAAAQVEVDGYVPGVAEDGGTCLLTLTRGGTTVTASVPGAENIGDTDCGGAAVPGSKLSQGRWTAVLSYESASTHGSSSPVEVQVP